MRGLSGAAIVTIEFVLIHAASRPKDDLDGEPHRWSVEADDYDQGMTEVRGSVPDGWLLMYVLVDRDPTPAPRA